MLNLTIDTGIKEYNINGAVTVSFNPTDVNFVNSIFDAFSTLDGKDEAYREAVSKETDGKKLFEIARAMDSEMRSVIDGAFGCEVCKPVFGNINVYAMADGLPLWANLLLAIIDEMDDAFSREKKASNPRLKKYTDKFKRAG